jgi:hypothetical protein
LHSTRVLSQRARLSKGSIESNWVIDSIFKLRIIYVREAAYKREKPNWRINQENKKGRVTIRSESCEGS